MIEVVVRSAIVAVEERRWECHWCCCIQAQKGYEGFDKRAYRRKRGRKSNFELSELEVEVWMTVKGRRVEEREDGFATMFVAVAAVDIRP